MLLGSPWTVSYESSLLEFKYFGHTHWSPLSIAKSCVSRWTRKHANKPSRGPRVTEREGRFRTIGFCLSDLQNNLNTGSQKDKMSHGVTPVVFFFFFFYYNSSFRFTILPTWLNVFVCPSATWLNCPIRFFKFMLFFSFQAWTNDADTGWGRTLKNR